MGLCNLFPLIVQLLKAMDLHSYIRKELISFPEASNSTIKVFVRFGVVKTGALHIASLIGSKA